MKSLRATCVAILTLLAATVTAPAVCQALTRTTAPATTSRPTLAQYPAAPVEARITDLGWFAPTKPGDPHPVLPGKIKIAYIVPIREEITEKTYDTIKRKLSSRPTGVDLVIFDMQTPGGEGEAMNNIVDFIRKDLHGTYTVAYVNSKAFSAGAIIALACDEIVMAPGSEIGDAMPIMISGGVLVPIPPEERKKFESAHRAEVENLAKANGYNIPLCQAMITLPMEVWLIRERQTRELQMIDPARFNEPLANTPPTFKPEYKFRPKEDAKWEFVDVIDGPDELVTLTDERAAFVGLSTGTYPDLEAIKAHYNIESSIYIPDNWSETLVDFLTTPMVSGALIFLLVAGVYALLHTGSHTSMVVVAVALALLLGSRYLTGLALWWEILVLLAGVVLILVEVFVIPGFGFTGILGILLVIAGLFLTLVPNLPGDAPLPKGNLGWSSFTNALLALCIAFIAATIAGYYLVRNLPRLPWARRLTLKAAPAINAPPVVETDLYESIMPGTVGHAETVLRPVGKVRIGRDLFDAIAEGEMITAGATIRVLRREGNTLVVEISRDL